MNKVKIIKYFMLTTGIITGIILVTFMILNHYLWNLDFIWTLVSCFGIILIWILTNYIGIKIVLHKNQK